MNIILVNAYLVIVNLIKQILDKANLNNYSKKQLSVNSSDFSLWGKSE